MRKIVVYKMRLLSRHPDEIEIEQLGRIIWNKDGSLKVQADDVNTRSMIENALNAAISRGIFLHWSKKKDKRITEYGRKIDPTDYSFPDCLAGQLFEPETKIGLFSLMADIEPRFEKGMRSWDKIEGNVYRYKE